MTGTIYQFGNYQLDAASLELRLDGEYVRLERKPVELLLLLATNQGNVTSRSEIADKLWDKEVFVDTEHGINTAIRKIRAALRDDPTNPRFIQTVPKVGYRFLQPVSIVGTNLLAGVAVPADDLPVPPVPEAARLVRPAILLSVGGTLLCLFLVWSHARTPRPSSAKPELRYEQLTDVTDSAVAPALSPDGRTLAFVRGSESFASAGPVYAKTLPGGEIRLLSSDPRGKYGLEFSPEGSEVAYTVFGKDDLATYVVPQSGGAPRLLLNNAAGLTWLDPGHLLYSESRSGVHLGVVTSTTDGHAKRDIYFPAHQRGMAHYSHASPDHRWLLVVEMDGRGNWAPCRLVSFSNPDENRIIGPDAPCTAAAWSPDGTWIYLTAGAGGQSHLWRQRFPAGAPEQVTSGATEEDGLAVERNGDSLITSIGSRQSTLWIHDKAGERALSDEGEVLAGSSPPCFREKGEVLYYLVRRKEGQRGAELWRTRLATGKAEVVFPWVAMLDYDVSPDGREAVFSTSNGSGSTDFWMGPTDQTHPPARLAIEGGSYPHFGPGGRIVFQFAEGKANYLEQALPDGSSRTRVTAQEIAEFQGMSPGRRWAMAIVSKSVLSVHPVLVAIPFDQSAPRLLCNTFCDATWSANGKFLVLPGSVPSGSGTGTAIPIGPQEELPPALPEGLESIADKSISPASRQLARGDIYPGENLEQYAFVNTSVHRNLFRITLK